MAAPRRKPFSTIRLACQDASGNRSIRIEIALRVAKGTEGSYNLDDFPNDNSDLGDLHDLRVAKSSLPANGRIIAWVYSRSGDTFLNDYLLTLKDSQVTEIEGSPWQAPPLEPKVPVKPEVAEATQLVHALVKKTLALLRRTKEYHWNGDAPPKVRISFHPSRASSHGDGHRVSFALGRWVRPGTVQFNEYAAFAEDPEIGSTSGDWRHVVRVLVAHELAHWVCCSSRVAKPPRKDYLSKPHGIGFQDAYRFLRARILRMEA